MHSKYHLWNGGHFVKREYELKNQYGMSILSIVDKTNDVIISPHCVCWQNLQIIALLYLAYINTLRPKQHSHHFAEDIFRLFLYETCYVEAISYKKFSENSNPCHI